MRTHLNNLLEWKPDLLDLHILDIGSGLGSFMIDVKKKGGWIVGIDSSPEHISVSRSCAFIQGIDLNIWLGEAEKLPFNDKIFDFVNICETLEHVSNPLATLEEAKRVLKFGGMGYLSVPSRYSIKDPHFDLYFVNWLPRSMAETFILIFGKHKDYSRHEIGNERLEDMHYFTYGKIKRLCRIAGFNCDDLRILKILKKFPVPIAKILIIPIYKIARLFIFKSIHLVIYK